MIIGDIKLSYPCVRYNVEVTHFTSRKSTAIEWVILEAIKKVSEIDNYSSMTVDDLFKQIFTISDSDLLIKPCLIKLQDLGAIIVNGLDDDTELSSIQMSGLKLTPTGEQMQRQGLLPGEDRTDNIQVYYDVTSKRLFENIGSAYKEKPTGIKAVELEDANAATFPSSEVRQLILNAMKEVHKRKYQWLQSTTQIKDLNSLDTKLMWKNVVKKIELGECGLCRIKDIDDDIHINGLIFGDGVLPNSIEDSSLPEVSFGNPDEELKDLYFISEINGKLNNTIKKDNKFVVDSNYWQPKMISNIGTKDLSVIIVSNADEFNVELVGKSLRVQLTENILPQNCIYLGSNDCIYAGLVTLHNAGGYKKIEFGYSPRKRIDNLATTIMQIVDNYYKDDCKIIMLLPIIGLNELMLEYVEKIVNEHEDIVSKSEIIDNIDQIYFALFNKKAGFNNMTKRIFVDNILENKSFSSVADVCKFISDMSQIKIYKNNDVLFTTMLTAMFEKTIETSNILDVWAIWKEIGSIKKSYISWIYKNGLSRKLYTTDVMKTLFSHFGNKDVLEIEEYTTAERTFIELNRIAAYIQELLPDVMMEKNYSNEIVLEMIFQYKDNISDLKNSIKRWRDNVEIIENRIGNIDEFADSKSQFSRFNQFIEQLMEASDIFFDEAAMKYSKIYIIDTCVLMNDSSVLSWFSDGKAMVVVPTVVLNELDGLKESEDRKIELAARDAIREISNYRAYDWFNCKENSHPELLPKDLDKDNKDNMILSIALKYFVKKPILLTDDINFSNKADSQNIISMNRDAYLNSKRYEHPKDNNSNNKKKKKKNRR